MISRFIGSCEGNETHNVLVERAKQLRAAGCVHPKSAAQRFVYLDNVTIGVGRKRKASTSNSPISTSRKNTL